MTLEVGSLLNNRYRIEQIISQGGMGAVYKAVDESLAISVAVKENLITTDQSTRQFRREATILATLRHPNLPRVTDHFINPNIGQYLVMDYVDGEDLRERMGKVGFINEDDVIIIGTAICDALDFLHSRKPPIIHRDIKPGNIKITPTGEIYLVDFGLAKIDKTGQETTTGAQALTPGYASPEQYGKGTESRSDIYSLGATLYAALTGKIPEDGLTRAAGSTILTPILKHNPAISQALASAIERAMAVFPADRYPNALAFKQALIESGSGATTITTGMANYHFNIPMGSTSITQKPSSGAPTPAEIIGQSDISQPTSSLPSHPLPDLHSLSSSFDPGHTSPIPPASVGPQRKKSIGGFAVGLIIIGVIGICGLGVIISLVGRHLDISTLTTFLGGEYQAESKLQPLVPTTLTTEAVSSIQDTPALATFTAASELPPTPSITPIGGGNGDILFASSRTGIPQIFIMKADGSDPRQLTKLPDGACQPDWSPDGKRFAFISPCAKRQDRYQGSSIFIAEADGSNITPLVSTPGGDFDPDWAPDNNSIVFTSIRDGIPHIYIYNLTNNQSINLSAQSSNDQRPVWSPDGSLIAFETTRLGWLQIWLMNPDGSSPREFTTMQEGAASMAAWAGNMEAMAYIHSPDLPWIAAKRIGVRGVKENRVSSMEPCWNPKFSPDNFWLLFESRQNGNIDIYRMLMNGGQVTRLTEHEGEDFQADWRPLAK